VAQRQYWCRLIKEKFNEENNQVSPDDPKVNEELLRLLIQKVNNLESAAASHVERDRNLNEALEENKIQKSELAAKDKAILQKDKHIKKLERMHNSLLLKLLFAALNLQLGLLGNVRCRSQLLRKNLK